MHEMIKAARLNPPNCTIRVPANSGPRKAMKRGALNENAIPVARERVGNNSGSQTAIQEYWPSVKNAFTAAATSSRLRSVVHRNSTGVINSDAAAVNAFFT